jgi:hypothetical protein
METSREAEAIRAGIDRARLQIEQSMIDLRATLSRRMNWRSYVRRHPAAYFMGAMLLGALAARALSR